MSDRKYTIESVGPKLEEFLRPILKRADFRLDFQVVSGESPHPDFENPELTVKFEGDDVDLLLANRGELLLALEHMFMEYMRMPSDDHSRLSFDANDYRMLRIEELRISAEAAAERVKRTGSPFAFNPMNSRERRVIHLSLRNHPELRSESAGVGSHRQVIVYPAGMPSIPPPPPPPPRRSAFDRPPDRDRDKERGGRPGGRPGGGRPGGRPGGGGGRGRGPRPR